MEIGEEKSLLSQIIGKDAVVETTEAEPKNETDSAQSQNIFDDEMKQGSLLHEIIGKEKPADVVDYKSQYEEKVANGEWKEIKDVENIEWNESSFKTIEEAQSKTTTEDDDNKEVQNTQQNVISSDEAEFRQGRIKALNNTDFNDVENAKELYRLYKVQQEGDDMSESIDKQIAALSDEELVKYAKTISTKIINEDEEYIKSESDKKKAEEKAREDNWNKFELSVVEAGNKMKVPATKSKEKLDQVKNGEFNKKIWEMITDPANFHKVFDFISDIDKYEKKIVNKTNSKLVVEALTKKNINTEVPKTNFNKINIAI